MSEESEYAVLKQIAENDALPQRALARNAGISLGMTNAILKRLARKGLLKVSKVNERKLLYAVTPDGFDALARRSVRYVRRTIRNVVEYREAICSLLAAAQSRGVSRIVLRGGSDVAFIVEYYCDKLGLEYHVRADGEATDPGANALVILGENSRDDPAEHSQAVSLTRVLAEY